MYIGALKWIGNRRYSKSTLSKHVWQIKDVKRKSSMVRWVLVKKFKVIKVMTLTGDCVWKKDNAS